MAATGGFGRGLFKQSEVDRSRKRAPSGGLCEAKLLLRLAQLLLSDELAVDRRRDRASGGRMDVPSYRSCLGKCQLEEPYALGIGKL